MSARELSVDERAEIFRADIVPLLFPDTQTTDYPTLTLVAGQPGSGRAQAAARLRSELDEEVTVLSAGELRAFHPSFVQSSASDLIQTDDEIGTATTEWLRASIAHAREHHRSVMIEGSFAAPRVVVATSQQFRAEGFQTRIVIVGARRAESLLSAVSLYLRGVQTGGPASFVSRVAHDRGFEGTRLLAASLEETDACDRVSILGRGGALIFDGERGDVDQPPGGATAALLRTQSERLTSLGSAQWLSELRRVTEYASQLRHARRPLTDLLIDLHETALREIIPELPVPPGSMVITTQGRRSASDLIALRRSLLDETVHADAAAPAVSSSSPDRRSPSR